MQLTYTLLLTVLLLVSRGLGAEESDHSDSTSSSITPSSSVTNCIGSESSVVSVVNASHSYRLASVVVNCLAFADNYSTVSTGLLSYRYRDGNTGRSTVTCVNNVLVVSKSEYAFSDNVTSCYECVDEEIIDTCHDNSDCISDCLYCSGPSQSECVVCEIARYNGDCVDRCPTGQSPNPEYGNQCQCPGNYGGVNCTECLLTESSCAGSYEDNIYFDKDNCMCTSCHSIGNGVDDMKLQLADVNASVPLNIIGTPRGNECVSHENESERRKRAEDSHGEEEVSIRMGEQFTCVSECEGEGFRATETTEYICYACGKKFCLKCDSTGKLCEECREGTLLNENSHECIGFYEEICERALELEHEVEEEEEGLKEYQDHLKIALPIVCVFVAIVFVGFAVFAHFRYPHVGHQKRHRRPNKATEMRKTEFDKVLRPQSTVIFR